MTTYTRDLTLLTPGDSLDAAGRRRAAEASIVVDQRPVSILLPDRKDAVESGSRQATAVVEAAHHMAGVDVHRAPEMQLRHVAGARIAREQRVEHVEPLKIDGV